MNPKLHHRFLSFILISLAVLGSIPDCVCQDAEQPSHQVCSEPLHCGSLSYISYPFWGGSRPDYCGYPGFEINCLGDEPLFNISSMIYRVVAIDNTTQTLKVSRNDLRDNLCPRFLFNTTLDFSLFDFYQPPNDQNITLYYGCPVNQTQPFPPNQFNCNVNETTTSSFFVTGEESGMETAIGCSSKISVRMNRTSVQDLANAAFASPIRLQDALKSGFSILWKAENRNCDDCVRSGGLCGYDQNLPSFACHCNDGSYLSICNGRRIVNGSKRGLSDQQKHVIIGVSLGIVGTIILSIIVYYRLRNEGQKGNQNVDRILLNHGSLAPKRYSYKEIKKITKSFTDKLGQGGYGIVYKGGLPDGQLVAVKVLKETSEDSEDFINEVVSISRTSHVNIVNLLGFCHDRDKRALVYEFMTNKSLDKFIYKNGLADNPGCSLEWDKLYKIAVGVARGLEYLHGGCNTRIVHFDIKPQNILLDQDFCPKISDFGLAKLFKAKQNIISMLGARGTIGYIAPEILSRSFGVVTHKSDVYSYGMMLLEMAEARNMVGRERINSSENYFPDKIYEHVLVKKEEMEDGMNEEKEESARKMLMVGFWCIQTAPSERPPMSKVVEMLEGSLQSIQIPPKPFLYTLKLSEHNFSSAFSANTETETGNFSLRLDID